jgi:putative protease
MLFMSLAPNQLELLAPARTAEIGREAILHGADAVYIGGPAFGARAAAANSVSEIAGLVEFAHRFRAKIFVTINTILHDEELEPSRKLIHELYDAGVDALIIQDMGILEMDLPPIQLHASTQCDIRTVEKAKFLGNSGFSQLVLARELTLEQIKDIHAATNTPLEFFVHGALCVAFSGQCYISHAHNGRSANRGDCSQACRLPYTLSDSSGAVVAFDKHLLSMKDNDQSANLEALVDAGIRSFKIEGRYKDAGYVKNITGHYRLLLDELLETRSEFSRASSGQTQLYFRPDAEKTFHRGKTDYFVSGRKEDIGAFDSPKYIGLPIGEICEIGRDFFDIFSTETLANGDGLNFMHKREVVGMQANTARQVQENRWRIVPNEVISELRGLKVGTPIHRNKDHAWEQMLTKNSAQRYIGVRFCLENTSDDCLKLTATDSDGFSVQVTQTGELQVARDIEKAQVQTKEQLYRLGNTEFNCDAIELKTSQAWFLPASQLNAMRRDAIERLRSARLAGTPRPQRQAEIEPPALYPETHLSYLANVYNALARQFYSRHGVQLIDSAYESHEEEGDVPLMITKHCLRFSFNLCPKQAKGVQGVQGQVKAEPMVLMNGNEKLTLKFDCKPCEMHVVGKIKKHILNSPPPRVSLEEQPLQFFKQRPQAVR